MKRWVKFLLAGQLALIVIAPVFGETEQPPFEASDPAINENFRNIYLAADKLNQLTSLFTYMLNASSNVVCIDNPTLCVDAINNSVIINGTAFDPSDITPHSSFQAGVELTSANVTGDGTVATVLASLQRFDIGGDYNENTGVFTAPYTGKYHFSVNPILLQLTTVTHTEVVIKIQTSNLGYTFTYSVPAGTSFTQGFPGSMTVDMDANDTCTFTVAVAGSGKTVDIQGTGSGTVSGWSGFLVHRD